MSLVRNATLDDIETILAMHDRLFDYKWSFDNYANELNFDIASFKVLIADDEIIGYYITHDIFEHLEIIMIVVDSDYQSNGYGQLLLNLIENERIDNGNDFLYLEVEDTNQKAINFYEKNDFIKINERKDYYGKGKNAFIYRK